MSETITVINNTTAQRFEALVDGHLAVAQYQRLDGQMMFYHTVVPDALQGRGIANQLARTALAFAGQEHLQVIPRCPFFAAYIRRHPEYQPLVDGTAWG